MEKSGLENWMEIDNPNTMLNEYYDLRGWSEEGIPTRDTLTELGLEECL